ncbi:MAG: mycothiol synthase [Ilumatobacteraceae bacterium]
MAALNIKRFATTDDMSEVYELLRTVEQADGVRPLSDHLWIDLGQGGRPGFAGLLARPNGHSHDVAYCQVSRGNDSWGIDLVFHPMHRDDTATVGPPLLAEAMRIVGQQGGGHVHWWVSEPTEIHRALAETINFRQGRTIWQMRVPLPLDTVTVESAPKIVTRPFRVGLDDQAWLDVNNRAFQTHPEQGNWTLEILQSRQKQPWFDPNGLLVYESDQKLAGFCWTKLHADTHPVHGEIYVVAVDPDIAGKGLGRALTVAGLVHLAKVGARVGMLFVDADNTPAVSLYKALGFTTHHVESAFVGDIQPSNR